MATPAVDNSRDSIHKSSSENEKQLPVDDTAKRITPKTPEERLAALQDALRVDPGPKPWGLAALQVRFWFLRLSKHMLIEERSIPHIISPSQNVFGMLALSGNPGRLLLLGRQRV